MRNTTPLTLNQSPSAWAIRGTMFVGNFIVASLGLEIIIVRLCWYFWKMYALVRFVLQPSLFGALFKSIDVCTHAHTHQTYQNVTLGRPPRASSSCLRLWTRNDENCCISLVISVGLREGRGHECFHGLGVSHSGSFSSSEGTTSFTSEPEESQRNFLELDRRAVGRGRGRERGLRP